MEKLIQEYIIVLVFCSIGHLLLSPRAFEAMAKLNKRMQPSRAKFLGDIEMPFEEVDAAVRSRLVRSLIWGFFINVPLFERISYPEVVLVCGVIFGCVTALVWSILKEQDKNEAKERARLEAKTDATLERSEESDQPSGGTGC